jgi:hypothetical protein
MGIIFNPLDCIIYFHKIIDSESLKPKTIVFSYDLINIIDSGGDIKNKCEQYVFVDKEITNDLEHLKNEIYRITPKLLKLCNPKNMMICFTDRLKNV